MGIIFELQITMCKKKELRTKMTIFLMILIKKIFFYKKCIINNDKKNLDFIFFGDSHAHMFRLAVLNFSKRYNKNFCFVDS